MSVLENLKNKWLSPGLKLDPRLLLGGMALLAAALALGVAYYLWRDQGTLRPLYGAGEAFPVSEVMQVLDSEGIAYQLHPRSGQVLVHEAELARARMLLAAKGVQVEVPPGYELFDKDDPLGTSQFVQDVRLKRSLEGELARSVMALQGVQRARVHLALEENGSFVVGRRTPPKASVVLQLEAGKRLEPPQVAAIVNLVANSVPQLDPADVSVVDQRGTLLSQELDGWGAPQRNREVVDSYQRSAVANIDQVLSPLLGPQNYRVSVAADIDFSEREETLQAYGDEPRLRREVLRDERAVDQLALGVPGSLSNTPPPAVSQTQAANAADGQGDNNEDRSATSMSKESTRQLDYDQSVTHIRHAPYRLRQQSVAVVLNAAAAPEGGWSQEQREQLETMVRSAVGLNAAHGDVLSLSVFPFGAPPMIDAEPLAWWEHPQVQGLARLLVFALISVLLLLMVVRPALRNLSARSAAGAASVTGEGEALRALEREGQERLLARFGDQSPALFSELNPLSEIRLPAPGSGLEHQIEHLQMLARNDPERVSEVLKQWLGHNLHPEPSAG